MPPAETIDQQIKDPIDFLIKLKGN